MTLMLLDFLIAPAYAQQAAGQSPGMFEAFWPLLVMIPLFYFLLIRPQMKRQKEQRQMLDKLAKGDEIVTTGGIAGRISGIGEVYLTVELADNVLVKVQKSAVSTVLPKGTLKTL
ncbi:MAG: preprotein translocase subunit YajC [Nevskiaceae bacterium]|nr:MAG: preprotein translocase subunit YajC [Nevskiaceae bacterium]